MQEQLRKNARNFPSLTNLNFLNTVAKQQKRAQQRKAAGISSVSPDDNKIYTREDFDVQKGISNQNKQFKSLLQELEQTQRSDLLAIERIKASGKLSDADYEKLSLPLNAMHTQEKSNLVRKAINLNKTQQANPGFFTRFKNSWYQLFSSPR